jgi:hypothetical protein
LFPLLIGLLLRGSSCRFSSRSYRRWIGFSFGWPQSSFCIARLLVFPYSLVELQGGGRFSFCSSFWILGVHGFRFGFFGFVLLGIGLAAVAGRFQVFLAQVGLGVGHFPVRRLWHLFLVFIQGHCARTSIAPSIFFIG